MKDPNEFLLAHSLKVLMEGPEALATMFTPKKPIALAEIRKHESHVNELIEAPRAEYFREAGIPPVPHPLPQEEIEGQLKATTQLWLTMRDKYGKDYADEYIRQSSRSLAMQDASRAQAAKDDLHGKKTLH